MILGKLGSWITLVVSCSILTQLELGFLASLQRCQNRIISKQFHGLGLISGVDVVCHCRLYNRMSTSQAPLLQVWWQGALQHSLNSARKVCPHCNVELTLLHMFFECEGCIQQCVRCLLLGFLCTLVRKWHTFGSVVWCLLIGLVPLHWSGCGVWYRRKWWPFQL